MSGERFSERFEREAKAIAALNTPSGQMMAVDVATSPSLRIGAPRALFATPAIDAWDVTRDGQRFLFAVPVNRGVPPYHVLLNWRSLLPER